MPLGLGPFFHISVDVLLLPENFTAVIVLNPPFFIINSMVYTVFTVISSFAVCMYVHVHVHVAGVCPCVV